MRQWIVSFAIMTSVLGAPLAYAQTAAHAAASHAPVPLGKSLTGAAKDAFDSAQVLVSNGDFLGAYAKFGQAYDLSKDPRLLFNMAVCLRNQHDYAGMQALLVRYKNEAAQTISPREKSEVDSALATIQNLVGAVKVSVSEAGAALTVDGNAAGTTPIDAPISLNLGKHTFSVSKDGFEPVKQELDVAGGSETPLSITLVAARHVARLVVVADDDATVTVDGQAVSKGRFDQQLAAGAHEVEVTAPSKLPFKQQVDLHDDETRSMDVTLEAEKHGGKVWPWIVGGVVLAAGASVGGYFLFKPQDKTAPVPPGQSGSFQLLRWGH
jgi:PEGA domain-containing protein